MTERGIHEAAAKHRDRQDRARVRRDERAAKARADQPKRKASVEANMLELALGEASYGKWVGWTATFVGLIGPMVAAWFVLPNGWSDSYLAEGAIMAISLVTILALNTLTARVMSGHRMRQLRRIGRGFKLNDYLDALRTKRRRGTLIARVRFARRFAETTRSDIPDAVRAWWPEAGSARWDRDVLVIESRELDGFSMAPPSEASSGNNWTFSNAPFHGALLAIIERVLPELASTAPIASFQAEITGKPEPWDAESP